MLRIPRLGRIERVQLPERSTQEHDSLQMFVDGSDTNMLIAGFLSDLAAVQTSVQRKWGYKQAAAAIRGLDEPIEAFVQPDGALRRIPRIGPASTRVIRGIAYWCLADRRECDGRK